MSKTIHIFGGGTVQHVRSHFALCAPAYGQFAREMARRLGPTTFLAKIWQKVSRCGPKVHLHLTKMADSSSTMETNEDVASRVAQVLKDPNTKVVIFNVAMCDYSGQIGDVPSGKYATRMSSRDGHTSVQLSPADKVLPSIHKLRPDVLVVGFKTTTGDDLHTQLAKARRQMDEAGVDLVWVNDTVSRVNFIESSDLNVARAPQGASRTQLMDWLADLLRHSVK